MTTDLHAVGVGASAGGFEALQQFFRGLPSRCGKAFVVVQHMDPIGFPPVFGRARKGVPPVTNAQGATIQIVPDLQQLTNKLLLLHFAPAALLTTVRGEIVYICGKAGRYLEPVAGKASMSLFSMAREGLSSALRAAFFKAVREQVRVSLKSIKVTMGAETRAVDVTVQQLIKPEALCGMVLIVLSDVVSPSSKSEATVNTIELAVDARMASMAQEVQQVRDQLKTSRRNAVAERRGEFGQSGPCCQGEGIGQGRSAGNAGTSHVQDLCQLILGTYAKHNRSQRIAI